jgi:hypothetical protein
MSGFKNMFRNRYKKLSLEDQPFLIEESKQTELVSKDKQNELIKSFGIFRNIIDNLYSTSEIITDDVAASLGFTTMMYVCDDSHKTINTFNKLKVFISLHNIGNIDMHKNITKYIDKGMKENNMLICCPDKNILVILTSIYILHR